MMNVAPVRIPVLCFDSVNSFHATRSVRTIHPGIDIINLPFNVTIYVQRWPSPKGPNFASLSSWHTQFQANEIQMAKLRDPQQCSDNICQHLNALTRSLA